jgi:hypothetical protein
VQKPHPFKEQKHHRKLGFAARDFASLDHHHEEDRLEEVQPAEMLVDNEDGKTEKRYLGIALGHRTICFPLRR